MSSILNIDENTFYFIIFEFLDDFSIAKLSLTCKAFLKLIEGNIYNNNNGTNFWKVKFNNYLNLFLQNKVVPLTRVDNSELQNNFILIEEKKIDMINERIVKFLNVYKDKMFLNLNELNKNKYFNFFKRNNNTELQQNNLKTILNLDKIKYFLLKYKFIFKQPNKELIPSTNIYPYYNNYHTLASLDQPFWRTYFSNFILQPKRIYHCCFLLSYYEPKFNEDSNGNAWQILIGVQPNGGHNVPVTSNENVENPLQQQQQQLEQPFNETWLSNCSVKGGDLGFGYCIKSDAIVENGGTSYDVKTVNKGGDCIGLKIDFKKDEEISLTFYLKDKKQRNFVKKVDCKMINYQLVVSLVKCRQLITLFPWDGDVETLKY